MKKTMLLISNMYPSDAYPYYGTFVRNFAKLSSSYFDITYNILYKTNGKLKKIVCYCGLYFKIIFNVLFKHYDIIYVHYISHVSMPLLLCTKLKKVKLYINVHGSDIVPETKVGIKLNKYTRSVLKCADKVIAPSSYFRDLLMTEYNLKFDKIHIYPSGGVDQNIFFKVDKGIKLSILEELNLDSRYTYWGFASRIETGKGWDVLVEALHDVQCHSHDFFDKNRFILIGSGKLESELDLKIEKYGLTEKIIRIESLNQTMLAKYYQIMQWFIFPTSKRESLGLVGLEAMACGTPIIATNYAGPTTYVINKENGLFFERDNIDDLADKILYANNLNSSNYNSYSLSASKTASSYLLSNLNEKFEGIFR